MSRSLGSLFHQQRYTNRLIPVLLFPGTFMNSDQLPIKSSINRNPNKRQRTAKRARFPPCSLNLFILTRTNHPRFAQLLRFRSQSMQTFQPLLVEFLLPGNQGQGLKFLQNLLHRIQQSKSGRQRSFRSSAPQEIVGS